ncbi:hypothetical protein SXCC_02698 [Gluconacetobacter sp. SXCC-1]|nr:hypothetical protein SXCC_02698 [Gluconacetobacter sp. SXCC-1]
MVASSVFIHCAVIAAHGPDGSRALTQGAVSMIVPARKV